MEFVHQYSTLTAGFDGRWYIVRAYADQQPGGLWEGWFVFFPLVDDGVPIATDRETTQSKREDVDYWASGITPVYLEGALRRAIDRQPAARLARHLARVGLEESYARAEAAAYDAAAAEARAHARAAGARRRSAEAELDDRSRGAA
jgi:hypothetical protein